VIVSLPEALADLRSSVSVVERAVALSKPHEMTDRSKRLLFEEVGRVKALCQQEERRLLGVDQ